MYYRERGLEDKEGYVVKSRELLLDAAKEGLLEPWVTFRITLLALLQKDDAQAEEYFRTTLDLDENYTDAHYFCCFPFYEGEDR
jgi:endo-1,4-beta-D-glucanase Y